MVRILIRRIRKTVRCRRSCGCNGGRLLTQDRKLPRKTVDLIAPLWLAGSKPVYFVAGDIPQLPALSLIACGDLQP